MNFQGLDSTVIGERLRIARSTANLTQEAVASALGVSRTTLVAIERGQRRVRSEEIISFARLYGLSAGRLTAPDTVHVDLSAKFRRAEGKSESPSVVEAIALLNRLATGAVELERIMGVEPRTDYPPPLRINPSNYIQQAEDAAISLRNRLGIGLGRAGDLLSSFELDLGIRVFFRPLADGNISGLYAFDPAVGACILVNANHPRRRRLQTLTHEGGHFVTDRSHADVMDNVSVPLSIEERFARRFGPAFLMPAPTVRARFDEMAGGQVSFDVRALVLLAHQFDVSTETMCRRLEELGFLAEGLWESLRQRGFGTNLEREALGDPELEARPALIPPRLAYLAARASEDGILSIGQLCDLFAVDRVQLGDALAPFVGEQDAALND